MTGTQAMFGLPHVSREELEGEYDVTAQYAYQPAAKVSGCLGEMVYRYVERGMDQECPGSDPVVTSGIMSPGVTQLEQEDG